MNTNVRPWDNESDSELRLMVARLLRKKWWIAGAVLASTILLATAALMMRPVYRASVVLVPVEIDRDSSSLGSALSQLGGLAAVAGLTLNGRGMHLEEALAVLKSRQFTEAFIDAHQLMPKLFAKRWDAARGTWTGNEKRKPTHAMAYRRFDGKIRKIIRDKRTGLVTVQIDWTDRDEAAKWANDLVGRLNEEMRARAKRESDASIGYLEQELQRTSTVATQEAIGRLIEAQVKQRMLANVTPEYAFRVVDKAMPPDANDPVKPRRVLMVAGGFFGGLALAVIWILMLDWIRPTRIE